MALKIGNNVVANAFVGSSQVRRAYKGGTLVYQGFGPASEQEFIRQEAAGGPAQLLKVYGKTIVNNQLVQNGDFSNGTTGWNIVGFNLNAANGILTLENTGTAPGYASFFQAVRTFATHKYLCAVDIYSDKSGSVGFGIFGDSPDVPIIGGQWQRLERIASYNTEQSVWRFTINRVGALLPTAGDIMRIRAPRLIDLTLRFGAGNEPTLVDEALRLLGGDAFDPTYDVGSLQSNKTAELRAERIPVINVWDEEWESGYIKEDGTEIYSPLHIKSAHLIPILPATKYWFKKPARIVQRQAYYDANGDFLSFVDLYATSGSGGQFTTPSNAHYLKFYLSQNAYAGDVCINFFDPAINGQYFPHWRGSLSLNLSTLTGKLNGEGASVVVYPDGLRGVGTDRDAAYGSTGEVARAVVDLGTLSWTYSARGIFASNIPGLKYQTIGSLLANLACSKYAQDTGSNIYVGLNDKVIGTAAGSPSIWVRDSAYTDAATFKAAMSGVMLDYPLATPLTYTLDSPLPTDLTCVQGDILQRVSDNNCPFVGEMGYAL